MHLIAWGEGFVFVGLTAANFLVPSGGQIYQSLQYDMTEVIKVFQEIILIQLWRRSRGSTVEDSKGVAID